MVRPDSTWRLTMISSLSCLALLLSATSALGHAHRDQIPLDEFASPATGYDSADPDAWLKKYGQQIDQVFSGPLSFSHLPYSKCLEDPSADFDIAVLGMPFDTAVTYRPGARFGPYAIRSGSRRQRESRGYTLAWKVNPYELGSKVIDCGDVGRDCCSACEALKLDCRCM